MLKWCKRAHHIFANSSISVYHTQKHYEFVTKIISNPIKSYWQHSFIYILDSHQTFRLYGNRNSFHIHFLILISLIYIYLKLLINYRVTIWIWIPKYNQDISTSQTSKLIFVFSSHIIVITLWIYILIQINKIMFIKLKVQCAIITKRVFLCLSTSTYGIELWSIAW